MDDELPVKFHLSEADRKEVFDLADKLERFKHPLEAPIKVAFMGTFRYENGVERSEVKSALDRKRLVALDQFLPMLDRVANNENYMHTVRARAAEIAEAIRKPQPQ